jgi:hypothetical protein
MFNFDCTPRLGIRPTAENIVSTLLKNADDHGPWIAGGMGRQLVLGEHDFNDIDVWFSSANQMNRVKHTLIETFASGAYMSYKSDNAETFQVGEYKVQLITKTFFKDIDTLFEHFDFTCCQVAVDKEMNVYGPGIEDAKNYVLKINKLNSNKFLARYGKYISYGYRMDPKDLVATLEKYEELTYEFDGSTFDY